MSLTQVANTQNQGGVVSSYKLGNQVTNIGGADGYVSTPLSQDSIRILATQSALTWGGNSIDFLLNSATIPFAKKFWLNLNVGALTYGATTSAFINDASLWIDHIDVLDTQQSVMWTSTSDPLYISALYVGKDATSEKKWRILENRANGTLSQRQTWASASQSVYIDITNAFGRESGFPLCLIDSGANITIKVYLKQLVNIVVGTGTLSTPSATITSAQLYVYGQSFDNNQGQLVNIVKSLKSKGVITYPTSVPLQMANQVPSGVTTYSMNLTQIVGNISQIWFIIRATSDLSVSSGSIVFNNYKNILSTFGIKNSAGNYIGSGLLYPEQLIRLSYVPKLYSGDGADSDSASDGVINTSFAGKYFYALSFSAKPEESLPPQSSSHYGSYNFVGTEQLVLNFTSSTSQSYQVDCLGFRHSAFNITSGGKITLTSA